MKADAGSTSLVPPLNAVLSDCSEESPEFLPEINPNKNGLNISDRGGKYFGEGRSSLNFTTKNFNLVI